MSIQIKLKNSVVQDSTPSTSDLPAVGEIALNANINSIGGFMRASDNSIVKIFGPGSLSTPTATTTVSGISELATNTETTTGTATNRVVTPAGLNAVTTAERNTSNTNYVAKAGGTLTGVLTATAGSNSAPAINFGDSDSGIFGGTNTVSLAAGGTTRLTADTGVTITGALSVSNNIATSAGQITCGVHGTSGIQIINDGTLGTLHSADLVLRTVSTERARIDQSGRLLVGHSSSLNVGSGTGGLIQLSRTTGDVHQSLNLFKADNAGSILAFGKSRSATIGSYTVVQDDDELGVIRFAGADGTDLQSQAASISAFVDGTPGSNDMPGRLVFGTTADGAASPTTRLTIDSTGKATFAGKVVIDGDGGSKYFAVGDNEDFKIYHDANGPTIFSDPNNQGVKFQAKNLNFTESTGNTTRFRINDDGHVDVIGNLDVGAGLDVTGNIVGTGDLTIDTNTLHVDSTNNRIGIGTAVPGALLHLKADDPIIRLHDTSSDKFGQIVGIDGNLRFDADNANAQANTNITFRTDNTERMRLNDTGLGIGTTSPNYKLVVQGSGVQTILAGSTNAAGATLILDGDSNGDGSGSDYASITHNSAGNIEINNRKSAAIIFKNTSSETERMRIDSSGDVGIGTSSPSAKLQVHGNILLSDTNAQIQFNSGGPIIQVPSANTLRFLNSSTNEVARFDSSGRLLIGTTTEGHTSADELTLSGSGDSGLTIRSGASSEGSIMFSDATSGGGEYAGWINYNHNDNFLRFFTAATEHMRILSTGNVGIGTTSPSEKLEVSGDIQVTSGSIKVTGATPGVRFTDTAATGGFGHVGVNNSSGSLVMRSDDGNALSGTFMGFEVDSSERMRIDSSGRVGIGTTSPSTNLHVHTAANDSGLLIKSTGNTSNAFLFDANRSGANAGIGGIKGRWNGTTVAQISFNTGNDTTDKNDGYIFFGTESAASNGNVNATERMRIDSSGRVLINTTNSANGHIAASNLAVQGADLAIFKDSEGDNSGVSGHKLKFVTQSGSLGEIDVLSEGGGGPSGRGGAMRFYTKTNNTGSATERMRIDSSGNVGIGSTPLSRLSIVDSVSSGHLMVIRNNQTRANNVRYGIEFRDSSNETNVTIVAKQTGSNNQASMEIYANNGSGGNGITGGTSGIKAVTIGPGGLTTHKEFGMHDAAATESSKFLDFGFQGHSCNFRRTNGGDANHSTFMAVNSSNVITGDFNDSSDEKLKKNILSVVDGAIENIKKLRPVTFDWIDETRNNDVSGFVAQELKTVLPNLVNGTEYDPTFIDETKGSKGGIKSEGYSINTIGLVAHLTKALQEAIGKIETLETKVAGLEGA